MIKINSTKKIILAGLIYGIVVFVVYILYTSTINWVLGGENFIYKDGTRAVINGLSFVTTQIGATVLSALIPIILLRYQNTDYYEASALIATVIYIAMLWGMFIAPAVSEFWFEVISNSAMNSFDAIVYGVVNFPLGALIGLLVNLGVNSLVNKKSFDTHPM